MKKFHILVYGCQMNYSDSARIKSVLQNCGWKSVDTIGEADIVIFDTCSVRQKSEDKITGKLNEIPKSKKIWITGCMVQHNLKLGVGNIKKGNFVGTISIPDPKIIGLEKVDKNFINDKAVLINYAFNPMFGILKKKFKNLELLFRIDDVGFLPLILKSLDYQIKDPDLEIVNEYTGILPGGASNMSMNESSKTTFVPIQTGCSQFCAYCIVPYARGLEKNRSVDDIISEVRFQLKNGSSEIVLLGQIVNKHKEFKTILKEILKLDGLKWLRYTSPYPTHYDDEIFSMHQNEEKLCPHIHIPLQSGSDKILKKMFRGYNSDQFRGFISKIREGERFISIHTDIIIGFCDEDEEDFHMSMDLIEFARFDMIYMGIYSPRPGTYGANNYADNVPKDIKMQRWTQMNALLARISKENNQIEVGNNREIMITDMTDSTLTGYTDNMKNVLINLDLNKKYENIQKGNYTFVNITRGDSLKLYGNI